MLTDELASAPTLNDFEETRAIEYSGGFRVGFIPESRDRMDEIHRPLRADGFDFASPRELFHGAWTFFLRAPGGSDIEVLHQDRRVDDLSAVRSTHIPSGPAGSGVS